MKRRTLIHSSLALGAGIFPRLSVGGELFHPDPATAAAQTHAELWRRFVDNYGILVDFRDFEGKVNLPTAEECRAASYHGTVSIRRN